MEQITEHKVLAPEVAVLIKSEMYRTAKTKTCDRKKKHFTISILKGMIVGKRPNSIQNGNLQDLARLPVFNFPPVSYETSYLDS